MDSRTLQLHVPLAGRHLIVHASAVLEKERIQINQRADPLRDAVGHSADHSAAVRVSAQHYIRKLLPANQVHYVVDMRFEVDLRREQMRSLSDARQRRREHFVPLRLQRLADAFPAPAAVPRAVNQDVRAHPSPRRRTPR